ncbi:MAG: adenosylcobalamin-dependent ribonucleoside-diphosphate reductase [Candidatus Woesearchaeota archaeon]
MSEKDSTAPMSLLSKSDISSYEKQLDMSPVVKDFFKQRYLKRDDQGNIIESPLELFYRVAKNIAQAEKNYSSDVDKWTLTFFHHLASGYFMPASPILMNAGNTFQSLFSDHALDVPDSLDTIFEILKIAASVQQKGGGLGFNFSKIRPRKDDVKGMKNVAFGPVSVMHIFDTSFSAILQGGRRAGANMAILNISHPDILEFIRVKQDISKLQNFNLSVAVSDDFMKAVESDGDFSLRNPRNNEVVKTIKARALFDEIVEQAWKTGDPGIVFIDLMNKTYPFKDKKVLCTGSCGQYELESFEGVPYTHLVLSKFLKKDESAKKTNGLVLDADALRYAVRVAVRFLDNSLDMHVYAHDKIKSASLKVRKIGLGVMGFADVLFALGVSYGSKQSLQIIKEWMSIIKEEAHSASHDLAKQRGSFPEFERCTWDRPMRHATMTSIAPTGSTSLLAQSSQSIEPVYAFSYTTTTSQGKEYSIVNPYFKQAVDGLPIDRTAKIQLQFVDTVQNISWLDDDFKSVYRTAMDVSPVEHLKVMAVFQQYIDNSISKTINLPHSYSQDDIAKIMKMAHKLGCKGITVYRDGCRDSQALMTKKQTKLWAFEDDAVEESVQEVVDDVVGELLLDEL